MSDYLWDRTGEPGREVQRLEALLGRLRHEGEPPPLPAPVRPAGWAWRAAFPWPRALAAASALGALVILSLAALQFGSLSRPAPEWSVVSLEGAPVIGSTPIGDQGRLREGAAVQTDASSRAEIVVGAIGRVELEPNTRVRMLRATPDEHRLALDRGTLHASIFAPPRLFIVDTPAAVAVDLGCVYTLEVDERGGGLLRVDAGYVELQGGDRQSFVPAGAAATMRAGAGPGAPYYTDASAAFVRALTEAEFGPAAGREAALAVLLAEARPDDALTLLTLLQRADAAGRERIYHRLARLLPPPPGVDLEGIAAGDRPMIGLWWDELGFYIGKE